MKLGFGGFIFPISLILVCQSIAGHGDTVTQMATKADHDLIIKNDGSLWVTGYNYYGELGDGTTSNTNRPEQIVSSNVVAVSAGYNHSLFLKPDGSLWAMGDNDAGEIGDGTSNNKVKLPELIVTSNVVSIAAGWFHSLFLKSDGSLWGMGYNGYGGLGDGTTSNTNLPEQIVAGGVVAMSGGSGHTLFIKSDGSLWGMGENDYGQLGDGTLNSTNLPEQILPGGVVAVSAGYWHSLFIKSDGSLWAMGYNGDGELGDGTFNDSHVPEQIVPSNVVAVAAGAVHSLFLKTDGSVWAMGNNSDGELGDGTRGTFTGGVTPPEQVIRSNVMAIATGWFHSLFLKSDGSLWGTGYDGYGELGDGFSGHSYLPEQILPSPPPVLTNTVLLQTNLQFTARCQFGGTFQLLTATNFDQPQAQWIPVATNLITDRSNNLFSASLTNVLGSGPVGFYRLQSR